MDEELFKLCKEVYKRFPEWNDTRDFWWWDKRLYTPGDKPVSTGFELSEYMHNQFIVDDKQEGMPAYTSDYLLDKLVEKKAGLTVYHVHSTMSWEAFYSGKFFEYGTDTQHWDTQGRTPLEALLRLVISLDDAGVKL